MKKAKVSKYGQWKYPGQDTIIPNANGSITMKGVPYPVLGIDDKGNRKMMMPGAEYQFPGNSVYEIPMMAAGGIVNPCPPGKVPDGKGNCVDDLTTPPIPSSSLYNYYVENLAKIKADPSFTDPDALVGQMIKAKRAGSCQSGECWEEEPEPVKVQVQSGPKQHYTIKESDNPGQAYLWKYTDDGKGGYNQELQGSVFIRDFLNDEQQVQFNAPTGGSWVVDYDPNVHKVYQDQHIINKTIEDERGWEQRNQNNLNREQQRIKQEKAYREQWEKEQKEKQKKRIDGANGQYAYGGGIDPDKPKIDFTNKTKSSDENYITKQIFYDNNTAKNKNRRTLKGFITGAPKPGEPGGPPKFAMGGTKMIKIKSLPKAQDLGELTPEQRKVYNDRYIYNREYGFDPNDSHKTALRDAQLSGNPDPIYNFQTFLPDPKVIVPAGKRFPLEHIDWNGYDSWQENYMSDPNYASRYNKRTPEQQQEMKNQINETENAQTYYNTLDAVKDWERNWYTKRAELPWFTDIANKRLNLTRDINMQPFGNDEEYKLRFPNTGGAYTTDGNYVGLPPYAWSDKNAMVHERSHWLDFNAPQNDDMYNGSYFRSYVKPNAIPWPVYNDEDDALYDIIPAEYKFPSGVVDPLRLGENDTNTYNSETEKIEANMPKSSDDIRANTVKIPFKGKAKGAGGLNNIEYFYNPTEVRARLNEWRFQHNIDPTKYYSNEELQQIIDQDIENNQPGSFDLYKVIQGRGDLLKKLHDTYVSTGDKENPDEMPKAQRGLRKDKDKNKVKKGKTLFGRPYQVVETEAGPDLWGNERPGETTRVKTVYYKNDNIAKQKIDNNENGSDEVTWHDKNGVVTAERNGDGYRTFSNGYFQSINNVDFENVKRIHDEIDRINPKNKLQGFVQRAKLNLENMSRDGSQPGDSYNTVWPDWENDRFNYTRTKNPGVRKSRAKFQGGGVPRAQDGTYDYFTASKRFNDEKNRIAQMRNNVIPISLSHSASSDNKPFNVKLPEGQHYCTTRACEIEREAGFPINQVASGYKIMKETTPENGWYPTTYDNLLPGDIAQVVRNSGSGHTMVSAGDAYNMPELWYSPADRDPNLPKEKGFFSDNGSGRDFDFMVPPSENELARWMENVKNMNYYTYKGNLPQYEKEYSSAVNNYLHDTSEGDAGPMAPIDAIPHKKQGGAIKQVRIKSLPKAQITGELSKEKQEALDREFRRQQATAWDPNGLNGAQEVPTDNVVIKPMIIGLPPKNAPKKTKEQLANEAAEKVTKNAKKDPTLWLLEHPDYMIGPTGTPVLKSSMESQAPAEYLTLEQKALKEDFIKEQNEDPLQRSLGSVTNNPQTNAAAERYANTELAAPLLEKNPRDKYATRAEWIESFNPQERAIIQGSNKSYKFNPNVWTTFSRALQTEGNRDSQWQRNLDLTQEEKNAPVTKMDRLGLLAPLAIPAYGVQRLLTGDYENLSDIGSGDTPKPYYGDDGTMRDYYQPQAQAIGNGLWQAALDPLNYIGGEGIGLGMLDDLRFGKFMDNAIAKSVNEFSALTPNFRAFDPKLQALRNMRGYGAGIGNGVLPGHDDIFRYLAEAERNSGVDRSYLMGLSDDDFLRHNVVGADVRDPSYHVSDDLLGRWQLEDARINNRVPLAPLPSEISIPYNMDEVINLARRNASITRPASVTERLFGRISDRVGALSRVRTPAQARTFMRNTFGSVTDGIRGLRRIAGDDVPISQVRNNFRNYKASNPQGPVNKSLLGKTETKALLKDKSEIDKLEKLSEAEFKDILITPDGKIKFPEKYTGPKQITKIETKDWVDEFNNNLDLLNRIIAENNTAGRGREYWVTGISEDGLLSFRTADGRNSTMRTYIKPGKFRGEIQDIADQKYMVDEIPGLQMAGASPIFGNAVRGTGTYKSLNEYLKKLDLGRVKSGMNSQSPFSRPLWENAIKKGDAFGFYASPSTVYGIMKKEGGVKKNKPGFQVLTDANGKYVFVKT